jgi:hypothetical protein
VAVEVRDAELEHYSASAVLVRFPSGDKVWLPLSQINQVPEAWALPPKFGARHGKVLVITDWIAKQKGFKVTQRELDIDLERAAEKLAASAQTAKLEPFVNGKPFAVAALEQQIKNLEDTLRGLRRTLDATRADLVNARLGQRNAEAQRDKAVADLTLAQDALRKANERADKAEAYIAAQGRSHRPEASQERFMLLELE